MKGRQFSVLIGCGVLAVGFGAKACEGAGSAHPSPGEGTTMTLPKIGRVPTLKRPIRIPKRVPLERAEPVVALAGETSTWRLRFRLSDDVAAGEVLKLQLHGWRNNKGAFKRPQVKDPAAKGYVTARLDDGKPLSLSVDKRESPGTFIVSVPKAGLAAGTTIYVTLGDTSRGGAGIEAPNVRMFNKFVVLYCPARGAKPKMGKGHGRGVWGETTEHQIVGACVMHILGGKLDHLRAYVPSQCKIGERIEILVRPDDAFSNLSHEAVEEVDVLLGDRRLKATVKRVEGSTCARVGVTVPAEGVHRFKIVDRRTGKQCLTNPTICRTAPAEDNVYWGMIHGHTELSDGWGTIDNYFRQMRDEAALDFAASSDHDHTWETPDAYWRLICRTVKKWHEPGRFVAFLGYEWAKWRRNGDGDRNVYYLRDDRPLYRSDNGHYPSPPDLFRALADEKAIVIPHHTGCWGNFCDWKDHDPNHERLVEIHQIRGCYECPEDKGNPLLAHEPAKGKGLMTVGFVSNALALGWRVGFTAGGDDHRGTAGTDKPTTWPGGKTFYAGSMGVLAKAKTRQAIWEAMWNRRVVATSGPRMLLRYEINGNPLGSELTASKDRALAKGRRVRVWFHGTAPVKRIDVIRNNETVYTTTQNEFEWEDPAPLDKVLMPAGKFRPGPFCFYYVRAVQTDGQAAWASPTWIDP